jgi:hypothetical protein
MYDNAHVIRIVEGFSGSRERGVVEVPSRREILPNKLVEVMSIFRVAKRSSFGGKVVLIPPAIFALWRQWLHLRFRIRN